MRVYVLGAIMLWCCALAADPCAAQSDGAAGTSSAQTSVLKAPEFEGATVGDRLKYNSLGNLGTGSNPRASVVGPGSEETSRGRVGSGTRNPTPWPSQTACDTSLKQCPVGEEALCLGDTPICVRP